MTSPVFEAIPDDLRQYPNWVLWRMEERGGKATKVPYDPKAPERKARADDPRTWGSWEQVCAAYGQGDFSGIGFQFSHSPFFGVDLDHKRFDGEIHPLALDILTRLDTYSELSPSRRGEHAIGRGALPEWATHRKALTDDLEIEVYSEGRFFTITGEVILTTEVTDAQEALDELLRELGMSRPTPQPRGASTGQTGRFTGTDRQLWERIFASRNGTDVRSLFNGDLSRYDGDHSRADFALCAHLAFWTSGDRQRMDGMFRDSGLMRPKWDARHGRNGETYGELTISAVLERWDGQGYDPVRNEGETTGGIERENWENPEVLLRGRQHLLTASSHGNTINSYSTLWHAVVQVIGKGLYTAEGQTLTLTTAGMTELYAIAGGRPVDRRNQLQFLHAQGMVGRLRRLGADHHRTPWVLELPANPAQLPFWKLRGSLQGIALPLSSHTGRPRRCPSPPSTPSVNNYYERENPKTRKMPFWTLFDLSVRKRATTAELAVSTGLSERTVRRHLTSCPTLVRRDGSAWVAVTDPQAVSALHQMAEASQVGQRRTALLEARQRFHEDKGRYLASQGFHRAAARHHHYAATYRLLTGVNAA